MICPRCSNEILENETICPFCHAEVSSDMEFNDFKEDGFVRIKNKNSSAIYTKTEDNKYMSVTRNLIVVSVIFLLTIAAITIFSFKALQYFTNDTPADIVVTPYVPQKNSSNNKETIKNTIKKVSIENLYGSWKSIDSSKQKKFAVPYFSFAKDGAAQYDYGSLTIHGYFEDFSSKNKNMIYLEIENQLCGLHIFDVTGNPKDGYHLTLKNINNGMTYYFETAEAKTYKLNAAEDYVTDKKIIGKWVSRDGERTYEFTNDGHFIRQIHDQVMKGVWTKSKKYDDTLDLKYMERSIVNVHIGYAFFDDMLIINDMMYYKK